MSGLQSIQHKNNLKLVIYFYVNGESHPRPLLPQAIHSRGLLGTLTLTTPALLETLYALLVPLRAHATRAAHGTHCRSMEGIITMQHKTLSRCDEQR